MRPLGLQSQQGLTICLFCTSRRALRSASLQRLSGLPNRFLQSSTLSEKPSHVAATQSRPQGDGSEAFRYSGLARSERDVGRVQQPARRRDDINVTQAAEKWKHVRVQYQSTPSRGPQQDRNGTGQAERRSLRAQAAPLPEQSFRTRFVSWSPATVSPRREVESDSPVIRRYPSEAGVRYNSATSSRHHQSGFFRPQSSTAAESAGTSHNSRISVPPSPFRLGVATENLTHGNSRHSSKFDLDERRAPNRRSRPSGQSTGGSREAARAYGRRRNQHAEEDDESMEDMNRLERKRQRKLERQAQKKAAPPTPIILPEFISVGNLAAALRVRVEDFVGRLQRLGFQDVDYSHVIDAETAGLIASEFNYEPTTDRSSVFEDLVALPPPTDAALLAPRPPVITIMGHVDHGKTTLLDWLRKSSVAASEHGGITQHIGAFTVSMPSGAIITFLDTPGHAAFLSMRQRGANVTDIVILVVSADDGVKPQTIEAISHAQKAQVPMIVAINKIDKPDANPELVKRDLARHGVNVEDLGGDAQAVCVSGKTGQGMAELEDAAMTLADVLDLRAQRTGPVEGWVLEAATKKAGRVATVLVRRGTLTPGCILVAGLTWARVRVLRNEAGNELPSAGPGVPVEVEGWRDLPNAGDEVLQADDEQRARKVIEGRQEQREKKDLGKDVTAVNEARKVEQARRAERVAEAAKARALRIAARNERSGPSPSTSESGIKEPATAEAATAITTDNSTSSVDTPTPLSTVMPFVLRADVAGSVEAVSDAVLALGTADVRASLLRAAAGPLSETDIAHAAAARGHCINFAQPIEPHIARLAEARGVRILDASIIYRLVDAVRAELEALLPALRVTRVLGEAEVVRTFDIGVGGRKTIRVAGCRVRNGVISKGAKARVLRDRSEVYDGLLSSLKNVKKDVAEMRKGTECGLAFEDFSEFAVGDQVQTYEEKFEKRVL